MFSYNFDTSLSYSLTKSDLIPQPFCLFYGISKNLCAGWKATMDKIKVLIADDHSLMREAMRMAIEIEADMEVVGEACDCGEAIAQVSALSPDVILIDIFMPDEQAGLSVIGELLALDAQNRIVVSTEFTAEEIIEAALQLGALTYLFKDAPHAELIAAIREAARSERHLGQSATQSQFQFAY